MHCIFCTSFFNLSLISPILFEIHQFCQNFEDFKVFEIFIETLLSSSNHMGLGDYYILTTLLKKFKLAAHTPIAVSQTFGSTDRCIYTRRCCVCYSQVARGYYTSSHESGWLRLCLHSVNTSYSEFTKRVQCHTFHAFVL